MSVKLDSKLCRVCLSSSGSIPIFDGCGKDDQFRYCTLLDATEEDSLPKNLCAKCNNHMKIAYDFRFQAIYAQEYFRKTIVLPSLKQEHEIILTNDDDNQSNDISAQNGSNELDENMTEIDKLLSIHDHPEDEEKEDAQNPAEYYDNHQDHHGENDGDSTDEEQLNTKPRSVFKLEIEHQAAFELPTRGHDVSANSDALMQPQRHIDTTTNDNASEIASIQYANQSPYSSQSVQDLRMDADSSQPHMNMSHLQHPMKQLGDNSVYNYQDTHYAYTIPEQTQIPSSQSHIPQELDAQYHTSIPANTGSYDYQYHPQYDPYMPPEPVAPTHHLNSNPIPLPTLNSYEPEPAVASNKTQLVADIQEILNTVYKKPKGVRKGKRDKIECNICGTVFTHINSLRNHMLIHSGQKPFKCEYCNKAFARKTVLNIHRRLHTGERPYKCTICDSGHVTKEAMLRHMGKDHEAETNMKKVKIAFICSICNKSRCSKYSLAAHMKTHMRDGTHVKKRGPNRKESSSRKDASTNNPKYTCTICGEPFDNKWDLSKHSESHEVNKSFGCDICSRVFEKKFQLLYHLQTHEGGEELIKSKVRSEPNQPKKESVESDNEDDLNSSNSEANRCDNNVAMKEGEQDEGISTKEDGKPSTKSSKKIFRRENLKRMRASSKIACKICEAIFTHPCSLKSHMLVHSGERPHKCDICEKSFARKNVLNVHRRLHTGEKPYKCPMCSTTAVTKDALMRHMSKDHDDDRELDKLKYTCGICQKGMASKYSLQSHMKLHEQKGTLNPDAKFKCTICNESFDTKCDYTNHVETHDTNTRTFQCVLCQATFEKKFKLLFHLQTHKIEEISCKKCSQTFTIRENLIQHVKTHIDSKNLDFQCPKCEVGVYDTRDLKLHMVEVHDISIGEINSCDLCGVNYDTAAEYYRHVNEKHDSINKSCHECDKYFESRKQFDKHMLTHYM